MSAFVEAPETPAPVFAVRAFKHAIFGTPQQTPQNSRRHSTNERERHRPVTRATRPQLARPKSAGDAAAIRRREDVPEPMASPTKGILMTPGTAAARRKTVTFGAHVVDNAKDKVKEESKTGLPNDCPGKFPSPWVQPAEKVENADTPSERKRGRSKLTEELHKARDESAKKKAAEAESRQPQDQDYEDAGEPDSVSGRYWKKEYDVYRANTTREVKKLVTKQRAAKSFARDKDLQCTELSDQLRQERKKIEKLESRTAELEAQLKALQAEMESSRSASPTRNAATSNRRSVLVGEGAITATRPTQTRSRSTDQPSIVALDSELAAKPSEPDSFKARTRKPSLDLQGDAAGVRSRIRHQPGNLPSDLWSHSVASPGTAAPVNDDLPTRSTRISRTVTSGTDLTPLKSLDINSRNPNRPPQQEAGSQRSPGTERPKASTPAFLRDNPMLAPPGNEAQVPKRCDSLDLDPEAKRKSSSEKLSGNHSPILPSSPFESDARSHPATEKPLPLPPAPTGRINSKENVSPSRAAFVSSGGVKDAVESQTAAKAPSTSMRAKDGSEVGLDRIAAAKARLAARGRKIS